MDHLERGEPSGSSLGEESTRSVSSSGSSMGSWIDHRCSSELSSTSRSLSPPRSRRCPSPVDRVRLNIAGSRDSQHPRYDLGKVYDGSVNAVRRPVLSSVEPNVVADAMRRGRIEYSSRARARARTLHSVPPCVLDSIAIPSSQRTVMLVDSDGSSTPRARSRSPSPDRDGR